MKRGFTMVETLIASAISLIALTAISTSFMALRNMLHTAMAETELSLAMRELRDKLLFKASPDVSGNHYGGLLSGQNLNENDVKSLNAVEMDGRAVGTTLGSTTDSSLRLLVWTVDGRKMLMNERTPDKDGHARWLWPGMLTFVECATENDATGMSDFLGYDARNANGSNIYRVYFDIGLAADVRRRDGARIVRKERVSVPVLGKLQPMKVGGKY